MLWEESINNCASKIAALPNDSEHISEAVMNEKIDMDKYNAMMSELYQLIEDYDMEAEVVYNQISSTITQLSGKEMSKKIGALILEYEFDEALDLLKTIMEDK